MNNEERKEKILEMLKKMYDNFSSNMDIYSEENINTIFRNTLDLACYFV